MLVTVDGHRKSIYPIVNNGSCASKLRPAFTSVRNALMLFVHSLVVNAFVIRHKWKSLEQLFTCALDLSDRHNLARRIVERKSVTKSHFALLINRSMQPARSSRKHSLTVLPM